MIDENEIQEFENLKKVLMDRNKVRELYAERIKNNINDSFYAENVSWEGKIKTLRTYELFFYNPKIW